MMPEAMLFDLDGVIADTAGLHFAAWRRLARELGGDLPNGFEAGLKGLSRKDSLERILAYLGCTVGDEELHRLMTRKNAWYRDSLKSITAADALPGARGILEAVRQAGIALALVSQSRNAPEILERLELAQFFDHVVDPSRVARGKPAPDIFLAAAGALNVAPAHCIGIEDAPAGILAIRRAGMFALGIGVRDELDKAHMVRADLASVDLRQLFTRWQAWRKGADAGKSGQSAKL